MKVVIVVDNRTYCQDDTGFPEFEERQEEIYQKYSKGEVISNEVWDEYDHDWRTDSEIVELAANIPMLKVVELPDNTTDFMTVDYPGTDFEELYYVVDGKVYLFE